MTTEYLGIQIDYERDKLLPEQGMAYLTKPGFYKNSWEKSPQETFARGATSYCFGDYEFAQRIYDYASQKHFTFASPVLSNAIELTWPENLPFDMAGDWLEEHAQIFGLPISCFLNHVDDSKEGLVKTMTETAWLSMMGGGVGTYMGQRSPDERSTGVMKHSKVYDAIADAYRQTATRRGSIAVYDRIDSPEIASFMDMRTPMGGDVNSKCFNLNHGICIDDKFMEAVILGEQYELVDVKHGPTGRFIDARETWNKMMDTRFTTGEPYMLFIDTVNRNIPEWISNPHYHVTQSNLCT